MVCNGCGREVEDLGDVDFICWHCAEKGKISAETAEAVCEVFLGITREELAGVLRDSGANDEGRSSPADEHEGAEPTRRGRAGRLGCSLRSWLTGFERREQVQ